MTMPEDPFADDPTVQLLCDVLDADPRVCLCGHTDDEHWHATWGTGLLIAGCAAHGCGCEDYEEPR